MAESDEPGRKTKRKFVKSWEAKYPGIVELDENYKNVFILFWHIYIT